MFLNLWSPYIRYRNKNMTHLKKNKKKSRFQHKSPSALFGYNRLINLTFLKSLMMPFVYIIF